MLFEFNFEFMEGNVAKGPPAISRTLAQPVGLLLKRIGWKYRQPDRGALMGGCKVEDLA